MSFSTNNVVNRALRIIRAENRFQGTNDGAREYIVDTLNDIISEINTTGLLVPFGSTFQFDIIPGQRQYKLGTGTDVDYTVNPIPAAVQYININQNGFRYPVDIIDDFSELKSVTSPTITGRPEYVVINFQEDFITLDFYGTPDVTYLAEMRYKAAIPFTDFNQPIELPRKYRQWMTYTLAKRVNIEEGVGVWNNVSQSELTRLDKLIKADVKYDNRVRTKAVMTQDDTFFRNRLGVSNI